jgi:hypothetical protein
VYGDDGVRAVRVMSEGGIGMRMDECLDIAVYARCKYCVRDYILLSTTV